MHSRLPYLLIAKIYMYVIVLHIWMTNLFIIFYIQKLVFLVVKNEPVAYTVRTLVQAAATKQNSYLFSNCPKFTLLSKFP